MRIDPNDPRITAYILDELDADERAKFEKEIEGCEESKNFIEEMCATSELLLQELSRESAPALASQQRENIEANLNGRTSRSGSARWLFDWRVGLLIPVAACAVLMVLLIPNETQMRARGIGKAKNEPAWQEQYGNSVKTPMVSRKSSDSSVQERPQLVEVSEPEWNLTAVSGPNIRPDDRNEIPRSEKISIGVGGQVKGEAQYLDLDEYVVDRAYHSGGKDDQLKIASTRSGSDSNSTSSPLSSGLAGKNPTQNVLVPNFGLEKEVLQAGRVSSQSSPTDGTFFRISELDAIALNRDAPGVPQLVERFEYNE
ncbi:MAG: zf-HC2 domain-containing protein, partial [Candidatus Omnitrophica bacterium]|nr:zf-HC2 domain-containing protein [Candidatus Omnitrophota bacterium]